MAACSWLYRDIIDSIHPQVNLKSTAKKDTVCRYSTESMEQKDSQPHYTGPVIAPNQSGQIQP